MLAEKHPDLFEKALKYEQEHADGRRFYWNQDESLLELQGRKDQIIKDHQLAMKRKKENAPNKPLIEILSSDLDDESDDYISRMYYKYDRKLFRFKVDLQGKISGEKFKVAK